MTIPESAVHEIQETATLYLHEAQREDGRELFGFLAMAQLELFWKLISISGVGPKSAQKIVYSDAVDRVKAKIMNGDLAALTDVLIGKKTDKRLFSSSRAFLSKNQFFLVSADAIEARRTGVLSTRRPPSLGLRKGTRRAGFGWRLRGCHGS